MKKISKILLVFAGLAFIVGGVSRFLLPQWTEYLWLPFAVGTLFFLIQVGLELKAYREFLSLRTTKHGMNMGVMILLVLVLLTAVNFVAARRNKKWDLSSNKINSLSEQTVKLLKGLDDNLEIYAFFREDNPEEERTKFEIKNTVDLLKDESSKVAYQVYNAIKRPDKVKEFGVNQAPVVVLKYKGKTTTLTEFSEQSVANGIVKVTRTRNKVIYFLTGHGEPDFEDLKEGEGAGLFKKSLTDASYEVRRLSLIEKPEVPTDADVLVVLGPKQALLGPEMKAIETYLASGGNLFVGVDPGLRHNIGDLLAKMGVVFENNYIIDQVGQLMGQSAAVAIGMEYSRTSEITKMFTQQITAFELASSIRKDEKANPDLKIEEIVRSSPASFAKSQIAGQVSFNKDKDKKGPLALVITVSGIFPGAAKVTEAQDNVDGKKREFSAVVFGDSDFAANRMLPVQLNQDLALNSLAFLAKDEDLISIKPKEMATTKITMTNTQASALVFGVYLPIPFIFLIVAGVIWFRRRGA